MSYSSLKQNRAIRGNTGLGLVRCALRTGACGAAWLLVSKASLGYFDGAAATGTRRKFDTIRWRIRMNCSTAFTLKALQTIYVKIIRRSVDRVFNAISSQDDSGENRLVA